MERAPIQPLKFEGPQTLEGLETKASQIDRAIARLNVAKKQLGRTDAPDYSYVRQETIRRPLRDIKGFARLNRYNFDELPPEERVDRRIKLGKSLEAIEETILPALETQKTQISGKVAEAEEIINQSETATRLRDKIAQLEQLKEKGLISEEDLVSAAKDSRIILRQVVINFPETKRAEPQAPAAPTEEPVGPTAPEEDKDFEALKEAMRLMTGNAENFILPPTLSAVEPSPLGPGIEALELKEGLYNFLKRNDINYVNELLSINFTDRSSVSRFGYKRQNEVLEALIKFGVTIKPETQEIPEEEKQRRQALLDVINSEETLSDLEKRLFELGVPYSDKNLGDNINWAKALYGDQLPIDKIVARLDAVRRGGLKKLTGKLEMVTVWPDGRGPNKKAGYYLKLAQTELPNPPKPEFGAEPVNENLLSLLNAVITEPDITLERMIELRGPMKDNKPFTKFTLSGSLSHAANVLMRRSRYKKLTESEKEIVDSIYAVFGGERVKDALVTFRVNVRKWLKEGTPIIPAKGNEGTSRSPRSGAREKRTINMPDGTILEARGKRGRGVEFIVLSGDAFSIKEFTEYVYGSSNQSDIDTAKTLLHGLKQYFTDQGWNVSFPEDLRDAEATKTFGITKNAQEPTAPAMNPEVTNEITELEQSLETLQASRPAIAEAAEQKLPGNYAADLENLDGTITQIETRLKELQG